MSAGDKQKIITQVQENYGIGPHFATVFLEAWLNTKEFTEKQFHKSLQDPKTKRWFDFIVTTNVRGRLLAQSILPFLHPKAARFLDAGCGYGGFLIGFHELGLAVFGFDLDPALVSLSRANLRDFNLPEEQVQIGNLVDIGFLKTLGRFDVITCNDVLEHVSDVPLVMNHLTQLLANEGILIIQVPDKDYIGYISHDGHYNLFGLTLLKHDDANQYYRELFSDTYDVGEYYRLKYYVEKLQTLGCSVSLLPSPMQKDLREGIGSALQTVSDFLAFLKQAKPAWRIKALIARRYLSYMLVFGILGFLALLLPNEKRQFKQTYLSGSWVIVARKK